MYAFFLSTNLVFLFIAHTAACDLSRGISDAYYELACTHG